MTVPTLPVRLRTRRLAGFTLLELIVVLVVLAILALIAIPSYTAVKDRAADEVAETSLSAMLRDAAALAAFDGRSAISAADLTTAAGEMPSAAAIAASGGGWTLMTPEDTPATASHEISYKLSGSRMGVATVSGSGHSSFAAFNGLVFGGSFSADAAEAAATGSNALAGAGSTTPPPTSTTSTTAACTDYAEAVQADSPLLYWRFDETSGTTAVDASTNGYDGEYTAGVTLAATGIPNCTDDQAASFDGSGDTHHIYATALNPAQFSLEAWVNPSDLSASQTIAGMWDNADPRHFGGATIGFVPHQARGTWLSASPMVVTDQSDPAYSAMPNPPLGGVFREYNPQTGTLAPSVFADDTAEALRTSLDLYETTGDAQWLTEATQLGTFLANSVVSGVTYGSYPVYFVAERWDYTTGWAIPTTAVNEPSTRTSLNTAYGFSRLAAYDSTTVVSGKTFGEWAQLLLDTAHKGQSLIAGSTELPDWMDGAMPEHWSFGSIYTPSWTTFPMFNADVVYMAFTQGATQFGDSHTDQASAAFSYTTTRDSYGTWLSGVLASHGGYMSDSNAAYVALPYQYMRVTDAAPTPDVLTAQNQFAGTWGDTAWTSDTEFWTIDGLARFDPTTGGALWDTMNGLRVTGSAFFYDTYLPDGSANSVPTKNTATQAMALAIRSGKVLGRDVSAFESMLVQTRWVSSSPITNGAWTWSGTWNEIVEGIASAVATAQMPEPTVGTYWRSTVGLGDGFTGADATQVPAGWSHVVLTFDGTTVRLFVNGTQVSSYAAPGFVANDSESFFAGARLATDTLGEFFSGSLDEVALYTTALSPSQIAAHYAASH